MKKNSEAIQSIRLAPKEEKSSLENAWLISSHAAKDGFEWDCLEDVWKKVEEEIQELKEAIEGLTLKEQKDELGDLLFSIVNIGRFLGISSEEALEKTNHKFLERYSFMEKEAFRRGKILSQLSLSEKENLWQLAKQEQR